jgi:hypothetical protein
VKLRISGRLCRACREHRAGVFCWSESLTSSPQITTYYLGYAKVTEVYDAARAAEGDKFELRRFMDGMMRLGPVRLEHYLQRVRGTDSPVN